ncbi:hypothetical protein APUTEX25_003285, partial [Auxenochlorella protothecoides]
GPARHASMGRPRKPFIDKKNSTTYNLIHRNTDAGEVVDASGRVFVDAGKGVGLGRVDEEAAAAARAASGTANRRYPPGHPLAWLEAEESGPSSSLTPARRRELIELGFPDDGYDYLAHLRALGGGSNALEGPDRSELAAAVGPGVFVPAQKPLAPAADVALYDAHALALPGGAVKEEEEEAEGAMGGVTAFTRRRERAPAAIDREELAELDAMLAQAEAEAEAEEIGEEGLGDLLDDFILTAVGRHEEGTGADEADEGHSWKGKESSASEVSSAPSDSESEDEDFESEAGDGLGELRGEGSVQSRWPGRTAPKAGSIASTYWREERQDRRGELTTLDDRFEHVALEYDEDEIGDLSDHGSDLEGDTAPEELAPQLAFLLTIDERDKAARLRGEGQATRPSALAAQLERFGMTDDDHEAAVRKAKDLVQWAEAEEGPDTSVPRPHGSIYVPAEHHERERWDAETELKGLFKEERGKAARRSATAQPQAALHMP